MYDLDSLLKFGKYKGKVLEDVLNDDPEYLAWCLENIEWFEVDETLADEIMRLSGAPRRRR